MHPKTKIAGSLMELQERCDAVRASGRKIVLTSGCFDLLHGGHLEYLVNASELGGENSCLVVGLNSDAFVKRLKGEGRPIRKEGDRVFVMAGFSMVELAAVFDDDLALISAVHPDVYVASSTSHVRIGDDAPRVELLKSIGAEVIEIGSDKTDSTTDIIKRSAA